jgi:hypothetical protein
VFLVGIYLKKTKNWIEIEKKFKKFERMKKIEKIEKKSKKIQKKLNRKTQQFFGTIP